MDVEYIKMCREAVEIQEAWKVKSGDNAWDDLGHDLYVISTLEEAFGLISFIHWLPRQEDLQEIAFEFLAEKEIREDFELFGYSIEEFFELFGYEHLFDEFGLWWDETVTARTFNEIWLCFVMETCYSKRWNADKETWEMIG